MNKVTKTGMVLFKNVSVGSKSERKAIVLVTDEGDLILRIAAATSYFDPNVHDHYTRLQRLIGNKVECTGTITEIKSFFLDSWKVV